MLKSSHRKKPHGRGKTRIPLRIACFFTAVVLLAAVAGVSVSTAQEDYVLGPEDVISVTVWGHNDLTRELQISLDGTISFPLIGNITAQGQTTKSLEQDIAARLADGYIVGPQLTVSVTEYRSQKFFIFGEVTSPGKFDLEPGITVLMAISMGGGLTPKAAPKRTKIIRQVEGTEKEIAVTMNTVVQPGDTIVVPESFF